MAELDAPPSALPAVRTVDLGAPFRWLAAGWRDFRVHPLPSAFYGACFATMGYLIHIVFQHAYQYVSSLVSGFFLVGPFLATAFGTFLIRQGFMGIPRDLRDASQLDGFGHLAFLRRVAIPVTRPVIASFAVISFLSAWNQYTWPRAVVTQGRWETIQIGLKSLSAAKVEESNIGLAAAILAALPILVLLIFLQRQLIRGLTAGAVKG